MWRCRVASTPRDRWSGRPSGPTAPEGPRKTPPPPPPPSAPGRRADPRRQARMVGGDGSATAAAAPTEGPGAREGVGGGSADVRRNPGRAARRR